jgi:hypothetical protein
MKMVWREGRRPGVPRMLMIKERTLKKPAYTSK